MVVGREATASVWRARDELRDRDVAVKQFHKSHPHEVVGGADRRPGTPSLASLPFTRC
jgi:hypothetical protein